MSKRRRKRRPARAARPLAQAAPAPKAMKVGDEALARSRMKPAGAGPNIFSVAEFPKSALPPAKHRMAMDAFPADWAWGLLAGLAAEGQTFLGFPYLAELAQRPEYRRMVEQLAFHMTRRWIRVKSKGGSDVAGKDQRPGFQDEGALPGERKPGDKPGLKPPLKPGFKPGAQDAFPPPKPGSNGKGQPGANGAGLPGAEQPLNAAGEPHAEPLYTQEDLERDQKADKIRELEDELKRLRVKQHFKEIVEHDGFFGRGHIFIDLGTGDSPGELKTPIGDGTGDASKLKIEKGALKGLKTVEPIWAYPMSYNAIDPLEPGWYRPDLWYVMRREVHRTRLLTFVSREVPDLLKPAYAFGGVPLVQMAKPYVDNWLKTRQGVSDLVQSFTQFVLGTDVLAQLANSDTAANLYKRLDTFVNTRNNRGVMAIDKDRESLENVSAPLGSLDALQAQAQEHMSAVSGIPIMFLIGDQPTGLNASSEGAIRAFYDWVHAGQEFLFQPKLDVLFAMAQLNIWGEVDEDLEYEFVPLWTPTEKEEAEMRKADADRDAVYLGEGVVHAEEVRKKLADDPNSGYKLDLSLGMPEPPPPELPPGFGAAPGGEPGAKPGNGAPPALKD